MKELIEKYENERKALVEKINADYDAKIAHIKKKKAVTGDNDIPVENIEIGSIAQEIADTTDLSDIDEPK